MLIKLLISVAGLLRTRHAGKHFFLFGFLSTFGVYVIDCVMCVYIYSLFIYTEREKHAVVCEVLNVIVITIKKGDMRI